MATTDISHCSVPKYSSTTLLDKTKLAIALEPGLLNVNINITQELIYEASFIDTTPSKYVQSLQSLPGIYRTGLYRNWSVQAK